MASESIKPQPLGLVIADLLRKDIIEGRLKGGHELRQEQLAETYGTSRIPVREAMQALERDGLITILPNRRSVVAEFNDPDIEDHYRVRALIEGEAAAICSRLEVDLAPLREIQDHLEADLHRSHPGQNQDSHVALNLEFHSWIWAHSGSRWLEILAKNLWQGFSPYTPGLVPGQPDRARLEHRDIITAIGSGDPEDARQAMRRHILRSCDFLLQHRRAQTE